MKKKAEEIKLDIKTLGYYIDRALCVMIKGLNKELKLRGLTFQHSDFTIMKVLNETHGLSQTQLAKILGKEKTGIGRSLYTLEKDGYVVRTRVNRCTNQVCLTEKGKEIMPVLNEIANKVTDKAFTGFSEKKRLEMMKNLTLIYQNSL